MNDAVVVVVVVAAAADFVVRSTLLYLYIVCPTFDHLLVHHHGTSFAMKPLLLAFLVPSRGYKYTKLIQMLNRACSS